MDETPVVLEAEYLDGRRIRLRFTGGVSGDVDLGPILRERSPGLLSDLRDPAYFAQLTVDEDLGTVVWPNGIDWDPFVLYSLATGTPLPQRQTA